MNSFDATTHTYTIGGRKVPSVTQVLSDLIPCYQAGEWYLQRGTAVHACAAMVAQGVEFEHDPQIIGQVSACRKFFAEVKPEVICVERQVFGVGYAGTMDMFCELNGREMVVDWKASFSAALPYQLAAYAMCVVGSVRWGFGVQLCEDGTYHMSQVYDLRQYKQGFLSLLSAYNIRRACKVKEESING